MKTLFSLTMVLGWLLIVGYTAHVIADNIASTLDDTANMIARS